MITCQSCAALNPPGSIYCEDCGAQLESQESGERPRLGPLEAGTVLLERYTLESVLEGGPITRYRATREGKPWMVLEARRTGDVSQLSRQRELISGLSGESLILPSDFFVVDDFDYAAAPWPGERLEELVTSTWTGESAQDFLQRLLDLLHNLHQQGVLSRSLQPTRIWQTEGQELRLDLWERACPLGSEEDAEEVCSVTPGFSGPEMYGLGQQGVPLDLFSVGALGYYLLSGKRLELDSRESFFVIPHLECPGHEGLVKVILKALRKNPEDRFASAQAMKEALQNPELMTSEPTPAPTPVPAPAPIPTPAPSENLASLPPRNGKAAPTAPVVAMYSHIGCVRRINQDACLELKFTFWEKSQRYEGWLVTVIDGMGGEAEGDKAASLALRTLAQEMIAADLSLKDGRQTTVLMPDERDQRCHYLLERSLRAANRTIFEYSLLDESRRGMGCTITACLLVAGKAYFGQVGDTRGYHARERLTQVTIDHSLVGRLVAMGQISPEEARNSPQRSIIYRALGTNPDVEVDIFDRELLPGDRIVLCSDGVWEYFEANEFEQLIMVSKGPQEICQQMVDICLSRGADDNATIAVIQC